MVLLHNGLVNMEVGSPLKFWGSGNPLLYHRFKELYMSKYGISTTKTLCALTGKENYTIASDAGEECKNCKRIFKKIVGVEVKDESIS